MRISDWSSDVCASDLQVFMREPSVRASRLAIAGGAAATIVIGAVGFFLGRATYPPPAPITHVVIEAPAPRPPPPTVVLLAWGGRSEVRRVGQACGST